MKLKFVTGHQEAVSNLYTDVGSNSVVCYDVPNFSTSSLASFSPPEYLAKCVSVSVAVSGDASHGREWMVICPFRVDQTGAHGDKVYDIDPFVATLDPDSGTPSLTGIVAYHQSFGGRTEGISGYQHLTKEATVSALRQQLVTGAAPVSAAPPSVLNALQHMAGLFVRELT